MKHTNTRPSASIALRKALNVKPIIITTCTMLLVALLIALTGRAYARTLTNASAITPQQEAATPHATTSDDSSAEASPARSTTVLVYLNGSDLESMAGAGSADITEMLDSGIGANANVIIETLGTRTWHGHGIASDHTQRYRVNQGQLELVDDSLGQLDTTAPETLADFVSWGAEHYPANRYILILWDHGAGPVYGFGYDEFQNEKAALTLDELQTSLAANPAVHFDLIGMDCCIMSSLETCQVLSPYCDYLVLSEDFEPENGWSYSGWMGELEKNPRVSTTDLGSLIVHDMVSDAAHNDSYGEATLALIDASKIPALSDAWLDFAYANTEALQGTDYSQQTEWQGIPGMERQRGIESHGWENLWYDTKDTYAYGDSLFVDVSDDPYGYGDEFPYGSEDGWYGWGGSSQGWGDSWGVGYEDYWDTWAYDESYVTMTDYCVTDLKEVASSVETDEARALLTAMDDAIVCYDRTAGETGMAGLAVTLPYGDSEFYEQLKDVFGACGIDGAYIDWLGGFVDTPRTDSSSDHEETGENWMEWDESDHGSTLEEEALWYGNELLMA